MEKVVLIVSQNLEENTSVGASFLITLLASGRPQVGNFIKEETSAQLFSCKFCEIFRITSFHRTSPVAISKSKPNVFKMFFMIIEIECFHDSLYCRDLIVLGRECFTA